MTSKFARVRRVALGGGLVVVSSLLFACGGGKSDPAASPRPVQVRVAAVVASEQAALEEVPGSVRPRLRATIEAKVSGRIEKLAVTDGQVVKQGQVLAELEVRELKARLDQALATQEESQRALKRISVLAKQNAATQSELEAVQARARVAEASVIESKTMLGYAQVTAPFNGVVTRKIANVGDLSAPGKALFEMEDPAQLRFEANVPEAIISAVKIGDVYGVRVAAAGHEIKGSVEELAPAADSNSRTYLVKLTLPVDSSLRSGQFGRVAIPTRQETALLVPSTALLRRGQLEYVYVVDADRAWLRLVRSGRSYAEKTELLAGVNSGEVVVGSEVQKLSDGAVVEVLQ